MNNNPDIYSYITTEENNYETEEIQVGENWMWNMRRHIQMIFHLKNGQFYTGSNDFMRAFKAVMEPILELCSWTEDIEIKHIVFFIEQKNGKVLSFLVKKYHDEVYTREHDIDSMLDKITDNDLAFGGVIAQKAPDVPEIMKLVSIAFCDQTNIMGSPIGFKTYFTPDTLRAMKKKGWGDAKNGATISIEDLCILATNEKDTDGTVNGGKKNQVPGKNIEVYIVRGSMPEQYLKNNDDMETYYNQLQIVAFYVDKNKKKTGVTLYRKKEDEANIKFFTSNEVENRALGRGVGERLLHNQIWTNCLTIWKHQMLEAGSKVPLVTDDPTYTQKNRIQDMDNLEITTIQEGKSINLIPTVAPANIQLFANDINEWYSHAQLQGAAFDPIMGQQATSGTTFKGQERTVAQGKGSHDKRRGKRSKFIEEIYRDWIIPDIAKEIVRGKEFLATLSTEEMMWIADELATQRANTRIFDLTMQGKMLTKQDQDTITSLYKEDFKKKGNKHLIKILKEEFDGIEIKMGINVAGKQKDLAGLSDKVLSIFQFILQNPQGFQQAMQIPALAKSFENILEFSGLSIGDFSSLLKGPVASPIQPGQEAAQGGQPNLALSAPNAEAQ